MRKSWLIKSGEFFSAFVTGQEFFSFISNMYILEMLSAFMSIIF